MDGEVSPGLATVGILTSHWLKGVEEGKATRSLKESCSYSIVGAVWPFPEGRSYCQASVIQGVTSDLTLPPSTPILTSPTYLLPVRPIS